MKEFNFVKIKNFCSVKVNVNSMTRKDTDWEKKIAKFISEIGSVIHTIQKKTNRQTKNTTTRKQATQLKTDLTDTSPEKIYRW